MGFGFGEDDHRKRYPPRHRAARPPPGESYTELVAKHGRPFGAFDKDRQLPYGPAWVEVRNDFHAKRDRD